MDRATFDPDEATAVLQHYALATIVSVKDFPRGSRQAPKAVVETQQGRYLLKRRAPRRDRPERVAFSHALLAHLAERDVPVAPPLPTASGATAVRLDERIYELFRFVRGSRYDGSLTQTGDAGRTLARFHRAVRDFKHDWSPDARSYHDPAAIEADLIAIPSRTAGHDSVVGREAELLGCTQEVAETFAEMAERVEQLGYRHWSDWIVHGDWHPGNLRYDGANVCVVLDFDSARPAPIVTEVANALLQFSILRDNTAPEDWPEFFDVARMRRFWRGYATRVKLDAAQREAIPYLMVESLIAECVYSVATTGSLGQLPGFGVMQMLRRKVRWLRAHLNSVSERLATS